MEDTTGALPARLTELEELAAHQAHTIDELSAEIASQWQVIDKMQRTLEQLKERFSAIEEASLEAPAITRPPHY